MVLNTNYSSVDALPTFNSDAMRETDSLQHPVVMKAKNTISNTRTPLFNRRQLALRDRIMSRLLTTSAPIRIRSKIYPTLRTANPNRVYVDSLSRNKNTGHSVLVRPRITKPTEIPAFLTAKFPIMSRNPNIEKYQFNRIRTATPLSVIFRHSDEDDRYSMEDLALVVSKDNQSAVVEKLLEITSGVQLTTAIPSNISLKFSNEQDSLENLPIGISWEPMKDGVSLAVLSELDASIDNSPELPGEISTESEEDLYPVSRRTLYLPLEQTVTVSQVQSTTATPWKASIGRFSDEQQDDISLEHIGQHVARGISWEPIKEQMLIMPEAEEMEDATEMVPRTEMPADFSIDDYTTTY
jgi:hypothetical protein